MAVFRDLHHRAFTLAADFHTGLRRQPHYRLDPHIMEQAVANSLIRSLRAYNGHEQRSL